MICSPAKRRKGRIRRWREYHRLITAGEATETWRSPVALPHRTTGRVRKGLPEGGVSLPKAEVFPLTKESIRARVQDVTTAGPEIDSTDPTLSPQVITKVTDIGAIQSDLRKTTGRAGEGVSDGFSLVLVLMASCAYEGICLCGKIKIYFQGS